MIVAMPYRQGCLIEWDSASIFVLYQVENNQVVTRELIQPHTSGEAVVEFLFRRQVNRVLLGSLDDELKFHLAYYNIESIIVAAGDTDELMERFLEGAFTDDD